jgi:drug/metabolite transporter (DMT)-like permease
VTFAFLFSVPFAVPLLVVGLLRQNWATAGAKGWIALSYMIFGASLLAHTLHLFALKRLRTGQAAIFLDLQPAIATGVAVLAKRDAVTESLLLGGAVALVGVVLVQLRR